MSNNNFWRKIDWWATAEHMLVAALLCMFMAEGALAKSVRAYSISFVLDVWFKCRNEYKGTNNLKFIFRMYCWIILFLRNEHLKLIFVWKCGRSLLNVDQWWSYQFFNDDARDVIHNQQAFRFSWNQKNFYNLYIPTV